MCKRIVCVYVVNEGFRHEWRLWRVHLRDFAPLLFQREATAATSSARR